MKEPSLHLYWDTCVFISYLNDERGAYGYYIDHIAQYLEEAHRGDVRIYCSTISIAEITEDRMRSSAYGDFTSFLSDFSRTVVPVSPDPIIMGLASGLRSLTFTKTGGRRKLDTPDAIHLATALTLLKDRKTPLMSFHTFDDGKKRSPEGGKSVPLISLEDWCESCSNDPLARRVLALPRERPDHPSPRMIP